MASRRKITQSQDRKRLKSIAQELEVPEGMGLIVRTAGASRTKQEIKRDFEYLMRLWESVRDLTLESTAPSLVYEEGNLIKRASEIFTPRTSRRSSSPANRPTAKPRASWAC